MSRHQPGDRKCEGWDNWQGRQGGWVPGGRQFIVTHLHNLIQSPLIH